MLDAFKNGEDLYCATTSQMFHVLEVKHGINGDLRQKGKIVTLACGYGGSSGALISMGALQMGLKEEELPEIIPTTSFILSTVLSMHRHNTSLC